MTLNETVVMIQLDLVHLVAVRSAFSENKAEVQNHAHEVNPKT